MRKVNQTVIVLGIITIVALIVGEADFAFALWLGYEFFKLITTDGLWH